MRLVTKKLYCPNCKRLVKAREQRENNNIAAYCCACGKRLYRWDGISWK